MKTIQRALLVSIVPFLTTQSISAEAEKVTTNLTGAQSDKRLSSAWRASEVIGTTVKNAGDETIGEIQDLAIDFKKGEILAVVVSSGGFLGVADTLSSVPVSALRFDSATKSFKTKLTKEQLQKAPQHKATEMPDYSDPAVMAKMREYRDAIGGDVTAPDNTAHNEVDAKEETLTPVDQGNSETDLKTTKDLRAAVVDSDLSFNAKNIKIITRDGHVTLRGVVDSTAEHQSVIKLITKQVESTKITDSIKVK